MGQALTYAESMYFQKLTRRFSLDFSITTLLARLAEGLRDRSVSRDVDFCARLRLSQRL